MNKRKAAIERRNVVDMDLAECFRQLPYAELVKSVSRRISDVRLLGWIKAWLLMPVEGDDGDGGRRLADRAKKERNGMPQARRSRHLPTLLGQNRFNLGILHCSLGFCRIRDGYRGST